MLTVKSLVADSPPPPPTSLNEANVPIYTSYWNTYTGLPTTCTGAIGESGAEHYMENRGLKKLYGSTDKGTVTQGIDQVWIDEKTGELIVVEAKGKVYEGEKGRKSVNLKRREGSGQIQATLEWTIEVCKTVLNSEAATEKSKEIARLVLKKISEGKLKIWVIVTNHIHGNPVDTWLDRVVEVVPDKYRVENPEELLIIDLEKGKRPGVYMKGSDPDMVHYVEGQKRDDLIEQNKKEQLLKESRKKFKFDTVPIEEKLKTGELKPRIRPRPHRTGRKGRVLPPRGTHGVPHR